MDDLASPIPSKLVSRQRKPPDEDESRALHDDANELCRVAVKGLYDGIGKGLYDDPADPDPLQPVWYDYWGLLGPKTTLLGVGALHELGLTCTDGTLCLPFSFEAATPADANPDLRKPMLTFDKTFDKLLKANEHIDKLIMGIVPGAKQAE